MHFTDMGQTSKSKRSIEYMVTLAAAIGSLASGVGLGWTGLIQHRVRNGEAYGFKVSAFQFSWIGSFFSLGAACICIPIGCLLNIIGRKNSMMLLVLPFTLGWPLIIWAQNIEMIWIGRFITGMGAGGIFVVAPLYVGEIASKEIRGRLCSLFQINQTIGILLAYVLASGLEIFTMSLICATIPIIFAVIFAFMPETPTFLVSVGKIEAAKNSIQRIRGREYDYTEELDQLKFEQNNNLKVDLRTALFERATLKAWFISISLLTFQQLNGINAIVYYPDEIFADDDNRHLSAIILAIVQVLATIGCGLTVDYTGRRISLLISGSAMILCTFLVGLFFYMKSKDENSVKSLSLFPVIGLCLYMIAYSLGFGPVPWIMMGELFTMKTKGVAAATVSTCKWLTAFFVTKVFVNLKHWIGQGPTFWVFTFFAITSCIYVGYYLPETKGKSFPEIQLMLAGNRKKRVLSRKTRRARKIITARKIKTPNLIQSSNNNQEIKRKKKSNQMYPF